MTIVERCFADLFFLMMLGAFALCLFSLLGIGLALVRRSRRTFFN